MTHALRASARRTAHNRCVRLEMAGLGRIGRLHAANLAGRLPFGELASVVDAVKETTGDGLGVPLTTGCSCRRSVRRTGTYMAAG